jgi:serine/threonine protein kinase
MVESEPEMVEKVGKETQKLRRLACLLHEAGSAIEYRAMRCIAMTERKKNQSSVALIFELPSWANPNKKPFTLGEALQGGAPSLTTRFSLAKALVSAIHKLHSVSWMHRKISSENVVFFQSLHGLPREVTATSSAGSYDFRNPYLDGFKYSRAAHWLFDGKPFEQSSSGNDQYTLFLRFLKDAHQHPSYLFHKQYGTKKIYKLKGLQHCGYHRFRHEYYSLGLILLEIGLWLPLRNLDVVGSPRPGMLADFWKTTDTETDTEADGSHVNKWAPLETWFMKTRQDVAESWSSITKHKPTWEAVKSSKADFPDHTRAFIEALSRAVQEEQIEKIMSPLPDDKYEVDISNLGYHWEMSYPFEVLRQGAIVRAEKDLGNTMGEKYQKLVLRCLKSDFALDYGAPEAAWLHAFNWHVVREIEQCCV